MAGLADAAAPGCGPQTRIVCSWVYEHTQGNEALARIADWFVGRPLAVVGLLAVGWASRWVIRRTVGRVAGRILAQPPLVAMPDAIPPEDDEVLPVAEDARRDTRAHAVAAALSSLLSALVWITVLIAICGVLGVDLGPLLASAGLAGIAVAFGAQSLIQDLFGGMFILIEDHFGIGDEVVLGEASGTVEKMTLRETVLRDIDGTVWHVRNGDIDRVGNHSQVWSAALLDVEVARGSDVAAAIAALHRAAEQVEHDPRFAAAMLEPSEVLGVQALTHDGITLRLRVRTEAGMQFRLERALLEAIEAALAAAGVERASRYVSVEAPPAPREAAAEQAARPA